MKKINFSTWPNYSRYEANLVKKIIQSNKVNYWSGKTCKIFEKKIFKISWIKICCLSYERLYRIRSWAKIYWNKKR